ncbi:MAG: 3-hydroxyacyl-ACP dehydratase FabZ [Gammaproteobacteria bacterium]|nr:3-hydroxyacyl-ACP dehydratase FabZ [Gammaproteobacteria bacterium]
MNPLNINEVMQHLPHRYPFLLIDKVIDHEPGESLKALKNVTFNEPFFLGHFPIKPVMPGVLILEALAQATGLLAFRSMEEAPTESTLYLFVGIDKARFKRQVEPGDQLILDVTLKRVMRGMWMFDCIATVDDEVVATADLMCSAQDIA